MAARGLSEGAVRQLGLAVPGRPAEWCALVEAWQLDAPVGIGLVDRECRFVAINPALASINGGRVEDHIGRTVAESVPALWPELEPLYRCVFEFGQPAVHKEVLSAGTGATQKTRYLLANMYPVRIAGEIVAAGVMVLDVTELEVAERAGHLAEGRYRALFEQASDAIFTADLAGNLTSLNAAGERLSGYACPEVVGLNFFGFIVEADRARAAEVFTERLAGGGDERLVELELIHRSGHPVPVEVAAWIVEDQGVPVGVQGIVRDMTERHAMVEQLRYSAFHDPLTGLPNRALFADRLGQALARSGRAEVRLAVVVLDLIEFKVINEALGHAAGDAALVALAGRLRQVLRDGDTVARLGGDEFALLLEDLGSEREAISVLERIIASAADTRTFEQSGLRIGASAGIAFYAPGDTTESLLKNADIAMYRAKTGGAPYEVFDDSMRVRLMREVTIVRDLERAMDSGELLLHYQPVVSVPDGRVLAVEALVRWPGRELQPSEFIPIAEESGLIVPLGRWVIEQAVHQAVLWRADHPQALPLGVLINTSAREVAQPDFSDFLTRTLSAQGARASDVSLEITERIFLDGDNPVVTANLRSLSALGINFVLDDFGTGYSALATLEQFPFATVKIDRFFIRSIREPSDPSSVAAAVIALAHSLGIKTIAEGVETDTQANRLLQLNCDAAQGYLYARPSPASEITGLLAQDLPLPIRHKTAAAGAAS